MGMFIVWTAAWALALLGPILGGLAAAFPWFFGL